MHKSLIDRRFLESLDAYFDAHFGPMFTVPDEARAGTVLIIEPRFADIRAQGNCDDD